MLSRPVTLLLPFSLILFVSTSCLSSAGSDRREVFAYVPARTAAMECLGRSEWCRWCRSDAQTTCASDQARRGGSFTRSSPARRRVLETPTSTLLSSFGVPLHVLCVFYCLRLPMLALSLYIS
ncbi:hypothetical protein Cni_G04430 [Canna indica]|uniref:Secreted protein n=1 Tax=Canna indica TaxID=4628 RepID=A0AAQ3Q2P5_9LILI|nr:hypothetical protein Cni_G04430 [Canna indica]